MRNDFNFWVAFMGFWQDKPLSAMSRREWESLCDGCAKCCLHKLEDEASGEVYYTDVACRQLDLQTCRCKDYANRHRLVPDCVSFTSADLSGLGWLPSTCAYRLLAEGHALPDWHPLITGDADSARATGHSVCGRAVSEDALDARQIEQRIVIWPE